MIKIEDGEQKSETRRRTTSLHPYTASSNECMHLRTHIYLFQLSWDSLIAIVS